MRRKLVGPDTLVARIAARQHGVITVEQLLVAGLSEAGIRRRVATGRLHRIHRGVYAVGHPGLSMKGIWKAATLACGDGAVLSHRSAAELWGVVALGRGDSHVIVPVAGGRSKRDGIVIHRYATLRRRDCSARDGVAVTKPARTLTDLRSQVDPGMLRRAVRQAEVLNLPIDRFLIVPDRTTSELERLFLALCRRERLPKPEVDVRLGPDRVDFFWRQQGLVVETDGYRYHRGSVAFEDDHARDNRLMRSAMTSCASPTGAWSTIPRMSRHYCAIALAAPTPSPSRSTGCSRDARETRRERATRRRLPRSCGPCGCW